MTVNFGPLERSKTYELVVREIKEQIYAGRLRPGDRLPGERQLSEQLQVSRPSVREAVRILETLQIVRSRPGNSIHSGLIVSTAPSRALTDLIGIHVALSSYSIAEVINVRMALEVQSVRRIASSIETTDISGVRDTAAKMRDQSLDKKSFFDLDTELHLGLARSSSNALLADLMAALREAIRRPMAAAFENGTKWPEWSRAICQEHEEILAAVAAGNADEAERLMRHHIEVFYREMESALSE